MTFITGNALIDYVTEPYLKSMKEINETTYMDPKGRVFERQVNPDTGNYWLVLIKDIKKEKKKDDQIRNPSRNDSRTCQTSPGISQELQCRKCF